ncbi:unnamed protein product [Hermetia illucens]|uniref:Uncharacterized protein n=1 Tax=Hermetia illucens TaxID=343691 RepID=A0A7R8UP10_HERIL|nr:unnamed protein product [Hermetia illucens]
MADELWINPPDEKSVELEETKGETIGGDSTGPKDVTTSLPGRAEKNDTKGLDRFQDDSDGYSQYAAKNLFSDSDFKLTEFDPVPYIFNLTDALGQKVILSNDRLLNARVLCPPYHILLDHLIAVLWRFYSKQGFDLLESSQIHWALRFLEGTKDDRGLHTADVQMAMDHLRDAYIDVCSRYDLSKLKDKSFQTNLMRFDGSSRKMEETKIKGNLLGFSIHLEDMVSDKDPDVAKELLDTEELKEGVPETLPAFDRLEIERGERVSQEQYKSLLALRNDKLRVAIEKIAELRAFDGSIGHTKYSPDK